MRSEQRIAEALGTGDLTGLTPVERSRVREIRAALANDTAWVELPEGLLARIEREVELTRPGKGAGWLWPAAAILAIVLGTAALTAYLIGDDSRPEPVAVVAITGTDLAPGASGSAGLIPLSNGWAISLDVSSVPPAPQGTFYQGWVSNGEQSVAVGTFHMRGGEPSPIGLWSGVDLHEYRTINVTLQDEGGGPASSGRLVLTGTADPFD